MKVTHAQKGALTGYLKDYMHANKLMGKDPKEVLNHAVRMWLHLNDKATPMTAPILSAVGYGGFLQQLQRAALKPPKAKEPEYTDFDYNNPFSIFFREMRNGARQYQEFNGNYDIYSRIFTFRKDPEL